jgi:hypothetical protein
MTYGIRRLLSTLGLLLTSGHLAGVPSLFGQAVRNQQKADELLRSAQRTETLAYLLAGAGILLVVAAIPLGIYLDRKKKARRQAKRAEGPGSEAPPPSREQDRADP